MIAHAATFSAHGDRHHLPARGAAGGLPSGLGAYLLDPGAERQRRLPPKVSGVSLQPGSLVRVQTPGGGGCGPPAERERRRVRAEVEAGLISATQAEEAYRLPADQAGAPEPPEEESPPTP